eukprot:CAMPEP_0184034212 /NCGR_PEP_ID=MMETSP0955-20130417/4330_1 /TAXON_ID=627963 /ORGANISM="Aplanochytrium sp, Strain PBS07" /LENGTH=142 /DNA_ID=CAMNT_0026320831 /DNA_START=535 /DNA_END=960 /DNA_ORIENTATION=+
MVLCTISLFLLSAIFARDMTQDDPKLYSSIGISTKLHLEQMARSASEHAALQKKPLVGSSSPVRTSDGASNSVENVTNGITELQLHNHSESQKILRGSSAGSSLEDDWDVFEIQSDVEVSSSLHMKERFLLHALSVAVLTVW